MTNDEHPVPQSANRRLWAQLFARRLEDQATLLARLDAIEHALQSIASELNQPQASANLATLQESLAALERQINKAGREQFKANTLAESQATQLAATLEALQADDAQREAELATLRDGGRESQTAARLEIVRAMLPALDGLDEAIRSGAALLNISQTAQPTPTPSRAKRGWLRRLFGPQPTIVQTEAEPTNPLHDAVVAWVQGLQFVRNRLLDVLANEGVRPIAAEGQPFDPAQHIAIQALPASDRLPPGTVAAEIRRGYTVRGRILRHAEVAVVGG